MQTGSSRKTGFVSRAFSGRYEFLVVGAAFLLLLIALFWRVVFLQEVLVPADLLFQHDPVWRGVAPAGFRLPANPLLSDVVFQNFPWLVFNYQNLYQGIFPLWDPFVLGGAPYLANEQSAILYPLNLLLYLLPMPVGIGYAAMTKLLVAGLSCYYYVKMLGRSRVASFIGACAFTFGGFTIVWLGYTPANVAVLLPLLVLFTERMFRYGGGLNFAGVALTIGVQFLGGHPETSFQLGVLWIAYLLFRVITQRTAGARVLTVAKSGLAALAAGACGCAIAAVQLLPFLTLLPESATFVGRLGASGSALFEPDFWHDLVLAVTIVFPNALGNPTVPDGNLFNPFSNYNETAAYIGAVPLVVAVLGALRWRHNSYVTFWLGVVVFCAGVAYHLPLFEGINHLPLFSIAINGRFRLEMILAGAVLSAFGTDVLLAHLDDLRFQRKLRLWLGAAIVIGLIGTLAVYAGLTVFRENLLDYGRQQAAITNVLFPGKLEHYLGRVPEVYETMRQFYSPLSPRLQLPVVFAAGLWLASRQFSGRLARRELMAASLIVLTVADLFLLAYQYNPTLPAAQSYPETRAITYLRENVGSARIAGLGLALTPNVSMLWGLRDVRGYENMVGARFKAFTDALAPRFRFGDYNLIARPGQRYLDLLGVKYVIAQTGAFEPDPDRPVVFDADGVQVIENKTALPRAYLVGRARPLPGDQRAALQAIGSSDFHPLEEVFLDAAAPAYGPGPVTGEVVIRDPSVNAVELSVKASAAAWLILSDTYDGGWRAYVDGREASIYRANYVMRAVRVDGGQHLVQFKYEPLSFTIGVLVSALGLLVVAAISLYALVRRYWRVPRGVTEYGG